MQNNLFFRRVMLMIYLVIATLTFIFYGILKYLSLTKTKTGTSVILFKFSFLFFLIVGFFFLLFIIFYFKYRTRNFLWYLLPFIGGVTFAIRALLSKKNPTDFHISAKSWGILALFGLFGLDQTTGEMFFIFTLSNKEMVPWQIIVDLIFFVATLAYFIYWAKKRQIAQWAPQAIWKQKYKILLTLAIMVAFDYAYFWLVSVFHQSIPIGSNQTALDQTAKLIPPALNWIHLAIGAPIMEETIFRVGIFELVLPRHPKIALVISALLFAFVHMIGNLNAWLLWPVYLVPGFMLAGLYYKSHHVEATATVHFVWNGILNYLLP